jgi:hypothetical protein
MTMVMTIEIGVKVITVLEHIAFTQYNWICMPRQNYTVELSERYKYSQIFKKCWNYINNFFCVSDLSIQSTGKGLLFPHILNVKARL